jgi:hypothetical protein
VAFRKVHSRYIVTENSSDGCVEASIRPAADSVDRGVLPRLKPIVMVEIVGRLPKVEYFVTVLDRAVESGDYMADQEDVEGHDSRELERSLFWAVKNVNDQ